MQATDPLASHASWMENFPWTRLEEVSASAERKPLVDLARLRQLPPAGVRALLGDGNFGGLPQRSDAEMERIWQEAVRETRELLESGWAS